MNIESISGWRVHEMEKTEDRLFYIRSLMKDLHSFIPAFLLSILVKTVSYIIPYGMAILIGTVAGTITGKNVDLKIVGLCGVALICLGVVLSYLDTYVSHRMAFGIVRELRNKCFSKIERIIPSAVGRSIGDYEKIINGDVDVFEWFYVHILVQWISSFIALLFGFYYMFHLSPIVGIIVLLVSAVILFIPLIKTSQAEEKGYELRKKGGQLNAIILDGIMGSKDILTNNYEKNYLENLLMKSRDFDRERNKFSRIGMNEKRITELMVNCSYVLIVFVTTFFSENSVRIEVQTVLISMIFYGTLEQALRDGTNYGFVFGAAKRVYDLLNEKEYVVDSGKLEDIGEADAFNGVVVNVKNLGFSYPGSNKKVIDKLCFQLHSNEIVALVAPSGHGKTTIVNLLERFWDYSEGNIYINHTELRDLKLSKLRCYISMVSQDIYLFNMSIKDNLRLAKDNASDVELEDACAKAGALGFIKELPEGFNTIVGERGTKLSGGQKQRIAIAQALLKDAPILIFDEATSNLDVKKELDIMETLNQIKKDKVILVVAHRQATIEAADRIVNLEKAV